jgi:hypothetical protein
VRRPLYVVDEPSLAPPEDVPVETLTMGSAPREPVVVPMVVESPIIEGKRTRARRRS